MGIILVYDCTDQNSFNNIQNWLKQIDQHAKSNVARALVANKCDKPDKIIDTEAGRAVAEKHNLTFFETSAKTGTNVPNVFEHIAKVIVKEKLPLLQNESASEMGKFKRDAKSSQAQKLKQSKGEQPKEGGCC